MFNDGYLMRWYLMAWICINHCTTQNVIVKVNYLTASHKFLKTFQKFYNLQLIPV